MSRATTYRDFLYDQLGGICQNCGAQTVIVGRVEREVGQENILYQNSEYIMFVDDGFVRIASKATAEHINGKKRKNPNSPDNLTLYCSECNRIAGERKCIKSGLNPIKVHGEVREFVLNRCRNELSQISKEE